MFDSTNITQLSDLDQNTEQKIREVARKTNLNVNTPAFAANLHDVEKNTLEQLKIEGMRSDIKLKELYAKGFLNILRVQLIAMNLVFIAVGFGLKLEESTINIFMTGTLAEVFGVVFVITRYLFPKK